jgi:hypothetical protein
MHMKHTLTVSARTRQLRTITRGRQEYIDHQPARATNNFATYTNAHFDKFFRIFHKLGVDMVAELGKAGIPEAMIPPDMRKLVDSTPEEAITDFLRSAGF